MSIGLTLINIYSIRYSSLLWSTYGIYSNIFIELIHCTWLIFYNSIISLYIIVLPCSNTILTHIQYNLLLILELELFCYNCTYLYMMTSDIYSEYIWWYELILCYLTIIYTIWISCEINVFITYLWFIYN